LKKLKVAEAIFN